MATPISLASRPLRCQRSLLFGQLALPFISRRLACSANSRMDEEIYVRRLSTCTPSRSSRLFVRNWDHDVLSSSSTWDARGKLARRCGLLLLLDDGRDGIGRLKHVRWLGTSRGLQEQEKGEKKISEKVSAATSKILSSLPIPITQHENIYTIPNILTFSRLVAAPLVGWAILSGHPTLALSLFAYAAVTDLMDGSIARRFNQESVVGTIIDPMADKLLMTVGVVCLSLENAIPIWLAIVIIGRDVGLGLSALYFRWISLPPPKTMARYWDFSLPSAEVKPTLISKINTALQLVLVWSAMAVPVVSESLITGLGVNEGMIGLQYLVAGTTVWSGLSYVFSKDAVKILSEKDVQQRLARQRDRKGGRR